MNSNLLWSKVLIRKKMLLEILNSEFRYWSSQELSESLGVSKKTVRSYIQELNLWIKQYESYIESTPKGYKAYINKRKSIQELLLEQIKKEVSIQYLQAAFNEKYNSVDSFLENQYITGTRFYSQTKTIREWLKTKKISIQFNCEGQILGEEKQIRYIFYYFFWETYKGIEWPFDFPRKPIIDAIEQSCASLYVHLGALQIEKIAYVVAISITRLMKGNTINDFYFEPAVIKDKLYNTLKTEYFNLAKKFNIKKEPPMNESVYLALMIGLISINSTNEDLGINFRETLSLKCNEKIKWVLEEFKNLGCINLSKFDFFVKRVTKIQLEVYFFIPIIEKKIIITTGTKFFSNKKEAVCAEIVSDFLYKIKQKEIKGNCVLSDQQMIFLQQSYTELLNYVIDWRIYIPPIQVQIELDEGFYMKEEVYAQIHWLFPDEIVLLPFENNKPVDLVITQFNEKLYGNVEILVWNTPPTKRDWQRLGIFLEK